MSFNDVAIASVKMNDFSIHFWYSFLIEAMQSFEKHIDI